MECDYTLLNCNSYTVIKEVVTKGVIIKEVYWYYQKQLEMYYTLALPFTLKSNLRLKKSFENSNISSCKNIIFKRIL
jgi:hypothetical protein